MAEVKPLAAEYYKLTGKHLGVTGEIGEMEVADLFRMELTPAGETGIDARRGNERVQIKTRARDPKRPQDKEPWPNVALSVDKPCGCDTVMLAVLDIETLNVAEVWEAPYSKVVEELRQKGPKGNKARERGQLAVSKFISMARRTWPDEGARAI